MASPAGANSGASSSRGTPLPLPFPFPAAAYFPSRGAGPFLPQHHHPPAASEGDDEVEEDEGSMDDDSAEEDDAELSDGGARGSPRRRAFSAPGIGRTEMNGEIGVRSIQEVQQWHQFGLASPGGDDPGTIPRDMRVENGYEVVGRREGGPASSYWDLLRAHLSDPLTGILMDDAMILSCGHSYGSSGMQHVYRMKACGKCGLPITEAFIRPNLALHLAVQAFKREEDSAKSLKRRRERLELVQSALNEGRLSLTDMQVDKTPFLAHMNVVEAGTPAVWIRPEQADMTKGKNVIIGELRPAPNVQKNLGHQVVLEKVEEGKSKLTIIVGLAEHLRRKKWYKIRAAKHRPAPLLLFSRLSRMTQTPRPFRPWGQPSRPSRLCRFQ